MKNERETKKTHESELHMLLDLVRAKRIFPVPKTTGTKLSLRSLVIQEISIW